MLRVDRLSFATDAVRQRRAGCAALLAAFVLSGCASTSPPPGTAETGASSRFTSLFSGAATPAAPAAAGGTAFNPDDCPPVDFRGGAESLSISGKSPESTASDVRYQLSINQLARQCTLVGTDVVMKIGVQGRIILGSAGAPGEVDIPLRYAVVQEGIQPKTVTTRFKRIAADVPPGQSSVVFTDVDDSLSFPMPSRTELAAYMVYVGFDEIGEGAEKKPAAKKPAVKRKEGATEQSKSGR